MPDFSQANIAVMIKELKAMLAARQVTVTSKREGQTFSGWATSTKRFGNGLEYVLILDTEWGFLENSPMA
jgi:hypothetical protein